MNYKERIAALTSFRTAVSGDSTDDHVSSLSSDISSWEGGSHDKFEDFIQRVKTDSASLAGKKSAFLSEVDGRIAQLQALFDAEVSENLWRLTLTYDSKDPLNNRQLKRSAINQLFIDSSVKAHLLNLVY